MKTSQLFLSLSISISAAGALNCGNSKEPYTFFLQWKDIYLLRIEASSPYLTPDTVGEAVEKATGIHPDDQEIELVVNLAVGEDIYSQIDTHIAKKKNDKQYHKVDGSWSSGQLILNNAKFTLVTPSTQMKSPHKLILYHSRSPLHFQISSGMQFSTNGYYGTASSTLLSAFDSRRANLEGLPQSLKSLWPEFSCSGCNRIIPPNTKLDECACCIFDPQIETAEHTENNTGGSSDQRDRKEQHNRCMLLSRTINVTFPQIPQAVQDKTTLLSHLTNLGDKSHETQQLIQASAPPKEGVTGNIQQRSTEIAHSCQELNIQINKITNYINSLYRLEFLSQSCQILSQSGQRRSYASYIPTISTVFHVATLCFFGYRSYKNYDARAFNINSRDWALKTSRMKNNLIYGSLLGGIPLGVQAVRFIRERFSGKHQ